MTRVSECPINLRDEHLIYLKALKANINGNERRGRSKIWCRTVFYRNFDPVCRSLDSTTLLKATPSHKFQTATHFLNSSWELWTQYLRSNQIHLGEETNTTLQTEQQPLIRKCIANRVNFKTVTSVCTVCIKKISEFCYIVYMYFIQRSWNIAIYFSAQQ
jgi:hypothetical protein